MLLAKNSVMSKKYLLPTISFRNKNPIVFYKMKSYFNKTRPCSFIPSQITLLLHYSTGLQNFIKELKVPQRERHKKGNLTKELTSGKMTLYVQIYFCTFYSRYDAKKKKIMQ